jgi:hypothetical protein
MVGYTRRNFLEMGLKFAAAGIGSSLFSGCTGLGKEKKSLDEVLAVTLYHSQRTGTLAAPRFNGIRDMGAGIFRGYS